MDNDNLADALEGTENASPAPGQSEEKPIETPGTTEAQAETQAPADSSLKPEEAPEVPAETQAARDFKELRERRDYLNDVVTRVGGESHLQLMQPLLEKAAEFPGTPQEVEKWAGETLQAINESFIPAQAQALRSEAAWSYLNDPASQRVIAEQLYGQGVTPELISSLVAAYRENSGILDETPEQETFRQQREQMEAQLREIQEQQQTRETEVKQFQTQQIMGEVIKTSLMPQTEVKKQFGLEFQKNGQDTPEIASWKERQSARYDRMTTAALMRDNELHRLANQAEALAGLTDQHRQRVMTQLMPMMEQRIRKVCSEVAQDLAQDLVLFAPELADRAKAQNLNGLPPQIAGTRSGVSPTGRDLSGMPDPLTDPRGFQVWVAKMAKAEGVAARTPGILQAG